MHKPGRRGSPREGDFREVINAVRYLVRSGCGYGEAEMAGQPGFFDLLDRYEALSAAGDPVERFIDGGGLRAIPGTADGRAATCSS